MGLIHDEFLDAVPLWDTDQVIPLLAGIRIAPGTAEYAQVCQSPSSNYSTEHNACGIPLYEPSLPNEVPLKCSCCQIDFKNRMDQISHYKSDWHRFNLVQMTNGFPILTYDQFLMEMENENSRQNSKKEVEDDSTSESCSDEETRNFSDGCEGQILTPISRKPKVFFLNAENDLISVYRNVLHHRQTEISTHTELLHRVNVARHKLYWVILLVSGGHFAGAIFKGTEVVTHKTFHSYTVRAKQGASQSSKDNKNATSHPKSAGASLRRYNELAHNQHVQEIIEEWKSHIENCDLIFFRCPKNNNNLLFSKESPILNKKDTRLRTIPFSTKKPTFNEVKRVHRNLANIYIHGKIDENKGLSHIADILSPKKISEKLPSCEKSSKSKKNPAESQKIRDSSPKKVSKNDLALVDSLEALRILPESSSTSGNSSDSTELICSYETMSTRLLDPNDSNLPPRKGHKSKENSSNYLKNKENFSENVQKCNVVPDPIAIAKAKVENFIYSACRTGNILQLENLSSFYKTQDMTDIPDILPIDIVNSLHFLQDLNIFEMKFGMNEKRLLHVASENGTKTMIWWLLENGCDPCVLNKNGETPYQATKVKESRLHFRRFMAEYPEKYNYEKAKIPAPLTREDEKKHKNKIAEKKKKQNKAKKDKLKKERQQEEVKRREEEERAKFLKLSDREKRAVAAEKRIAEQTKLLTETSKTSENSPGVSGNVFLVRCFECGNQINVIPFEYLEFKFCSTNCVRKHRSKNN